jgi:hypothetical protein
MSSVLDDALDRLHSTGPEQHNGAPNHGPMVVETLTILDCSDLVSGWLDQYWRELEPASRPQSPIVLDAWDRALGFPSRYADWEVFFNARLAEKPWRELLSEWIPRLIPGVTAYGTHGLIRTAHAARALATAETSPRLAELTSGLSTWAAYFQLLPGVPRLTGSRDIVDALDALPRLPADAERGGPPPKVLRALNALPTLPSGVDELATPTDIWESLSKLSEAGARLYLTHAARHPLVFVHAVTGPAAFRTLLPYIRKWDQLSAFAYMWQAIAASASAFGSAPIAVGPLEMDVDADPVVADDIKGRSIDTHDQHAIKFFDACLRETELNPTPVYLRAANDWANRVLQARTWSHGQRIATGLSTV